MGIAEYRVGLPSELASSLPSTKDIVLQLTGATVNVEGHAPTVLVSGKTQTKAAVAKKKALERQPAAKTAGARDRKAARDD